MQGSETWRSPTILIKLLILSKYMFLVLFVFLTICFGYAFGMFDKYYMNKNVQILKIMIELKQFACYKFGYRGTRLGNANVQILIMWQKHNDNKL